MNTTDELVFWMGEQGRKAIEKMGWPEWDVGTYGHMRLVYARPDFSQMCQPPDGGTEIHYGTLFNYDALCLLNEHARRRLAARGIYLYMPQADMWTVERQGGRWFLCSEGWKLADVGAGHPDYNFIAQVYGTYTAALIAGLLAEEKPNA